MPRESTYEGRYIILPGDPDWTNEDWISQRDIILPGDPDFYIPLTPPPNWREVAHKGDGIAFVAEAGSGLFRAVNLIELDDYIYGGEYDDRLSEIGEDFDDQWD